MYKFIFVFCVSRVQKRNSEFNLSFWSHPRITSRCIPIRVASRTRPDKNYVQIHKKTAFRLGYITKLIVLYQAEQTDDFYTPSSVWKRPISYNAYNFTQCFDNY